MKSSVATFARSDSGKSGERTPLLLNGSQGGENGIVNDGSGEAGRELSGLALLWKDDALRSFYCGSEEDGVLHVSSTIWKDLRTPADQLTVVDAVGGQGATAQVSTLILYSQTLFLFSKSFLYLNVYTLYNF